MDTPEDSQLDNATNGKESGLESRSGTMHDTREGLTLSARVDEDHTSMGGFLTSRRELETLPPGEPRFLQLTPTGGAGSVIREPEKEVEIKQQEAGRSRIEITSQKLPESQCQCRAPLAVSAETRRRLSTKAHRVAAKLRAGGEASVCEGVEDDKDSTSTDDVGQARGTRESRTNQQLAALRQEMADEMERMLDQRWQVLVHNTNARVDMVLGQLMYAQHTTMEMQQQHIAESASRQQHAEEQRQSAPELRQAVRCQQQMLDRLIETVDDVSSNSEHRAVRLEDTLTSRLDEVQQKHCDLEYRLTAVVAAYQGRPPASVSHSEMEANASNLSTSALHLWTEEEIESDLRQACDDVRLRVNMMENGLDDTYCTWRELA